MKFANVTRKAYAGFTLIELMVTVAIVAILASIAVPSYRDYIVRSKIPDATSWLAAKRVQMEQWFQDTQSYANAPACTQDTASSKYFTFDCSVAGTATQFTLRATGTGSMNGFVYTVDQNNAKATTIDSSAQPGWTSNASCWVTAKGGTC